MSKITSVQLSGLALVKWLRGEAEGYAVQAVGLPPGRLRATAVAIGGTCDAIANDLEGAMVAAGMATSDDGRAARDVEHINEIRNAILGEREACAQIAEDAFCDTVAESIRSRT